MIYSLDEAEHDYHIYAHALNDPSSYLALIFSSLKAVGLIHSHRGPGGGYSLAKELGMVSVKDIVDTTGESPSLEGDPST